MKNLYVPNSYEFRVADNDAATQLLRKGWVECPPKPAENSYWQTGAWVTPTPEPAVKTWSIQQFRDLFTDAEISEFLDAAKTNPIVDLMRFKLTTADEICSNSDDLKAALSALVALGVITQEKADTILAV